jgi:Xaa-Pro aminopeptidase
LPKACKNPLEIEGMRKAHIRDGAALARYLAWFESNAAGGD